MVNNVYQTYMREYIIALVIAEAECLSMRQLILHRVSLAFSSHFNCVDINGEGHTLVLYMRGIVKLESIVGSCFC